MNFTINKAPFAAVLARVQGITAGRSSMPILANVHLQINALRPALHVSATDLEVGYTTVVDLEEQPEHAGAITLPAKKLHEIVKACPAHDITVSIDLGNMRATIVSGTYTATLAGIDAGEFPEMPAVEGESFDLDAAALLQVFAHVDYCQSHDADKYNLCGCFLKMETNVDDDLFLYACATDGHRLALDGTPLPGDPRPIPKDLAKGIIIASKGVAEIRKISKAGVIVLNIAGNHLQIATETEKMFFRLVDGQFPDYNRVIPEKLTYKAEVKRPALIEALERCRILSDGKSRKVGLDFSDGGIALSSELVAYGESHDRVSCEVSCEPCVIYVNVDYLLGALESMDYGAVEISFTDGMVALMVNPQGTDEPVAVIMPQRG